MKTTIIKKEDNKRKWYLIDAKDKILGKIAPIIANKLRGKDKPHFSPHLDHGDFIIVVNAEKVKLTANKKEDKTYYSHTGFPGRLIEEKAKNLLQRKPTKVLELAVSGMLPKNKLRAVFMKKLKLFAGETHTHQSQSPEKLEV
jgi:large subunit ribosomal protein L13